MDLASFFSFGSKPRVRMAPSPTGNLHIGTARTTLFNFLFARHTNGTFIMRIEDTDKERSTKEFEKDITDNLTWLGLSWDEFYRQSERTDLYTKKLQELVDNGKAFVSKEESVASPGTIVEVVRLKNHGGEVTFTDLLRGEIKTDVSDLGDFVIARAIDDPLYHFAVVVDDGEMGITHVFRSDDHISNTPRQILILEALGFTRPQYIHQPLVLAGDRSKLSKRHGATALSDYRREGFIKEGIINYLAFLGWNPGTDQEIFTLDELISLFDVKKLQKGGAVFDMNKFLWFNREHIKRLTDEELGNRLEQFGTSVDTRLIPLLKERISTLKEADDLLKAGEFSYAEALEEYPSELLLPTTKSGKGNREDTRSHLLHVHEVLNALSPWEAKTVKEAVWSYAEARGKAAVLWPMRVALTGKEKSADPFAVAELLGKEETLKRLQSAHKSL